jgi:sarcosine oxidase subunit beta
MTSNRTWDSIVVGGGLVGSSCAYQLAKSGLKTLLIEQGELASGASGANFGNVQVQDADYGFSLDLTIAGAQRCADLEYELDFDLGYRQTGSLLLIENAHQHTMMVERLRHLDAAGLSAQLLDQDELVQVEPYLNPETFIGGLYHPGEGQLNPFKLVHAYVHRGQQFGLEVSPHTAVTELITQHGKVIGVKTQNGILTAGCVVLATGAWTHSLGKTADLELAAEWVHGEAIITEPLPPSVSNALSSASFFEETAKAAGTIVAFAMKQRTEGNLMLGEATTITPRLDREVAEYSVKVVAAEARRRLPRLKQTAILRSWGIPIAHTADHKPLLGFVDEIEHLLVAAGLKSTIVLTPIVGEVVAKMITGQETDPRFAEFSLSRKINRP